MENKKIEKVQTLPIKSPKLLKEFIDGHQGLVFDYMLKCLKKAIRENLSEVILFKLGDSNNLALIKRAEYPESLNSMIAYYIKVEEYEKVIVCKDLLQKHHVNTVIDETRKP